MRKRYLEAGEVVSTHGVRGEMRVQPWCDSPEMLAKLRTLYWDAEGRQPVRVKSRPHKTLVLMKADGIDTVQDAAARRGHVLYLDRRDIKLAEGQYFICDLIGLRVINAATGEEYGMLTDVSATGANDVYHMDYQGREVLIPVIPPVIDTVDVDGGVVKIHPLEGLFDL
ncbi:MAG: 16S rRNA processing protein RimM [Ruminococcaceae bacterium]|nr:16S rRNA processing protein RimM [Oscillospiraceae bacterium]